MTYQVQSKYCLPVGHPNRPGRKLIAVRGLVFHWTGNLSKGADDIANARYFGRPFEKDNGRTEEKGTDNPFRYASAHYTVDQDSIQLCIPENEVAYHVGDNKYTAFAKARYTNGGKCRPNEFLIGIELCVNAGNDWNKTLALAIELGSDIMIRHNLSIDQVIRHYDVTGKACPRMFVEDPKAWADFKTRLAQRVAEKKNPPKVVQKGASGMFKDVADNHWAKAEVEALGKMGILKGDANGNFDPNKPITRAETAVLIYRALKATGQIK